MATYILDQFDRADFNAGEPIHAQSRQTALETFVDRFVCGQANEGIVDAITRPKFTGRFDFAGFGYKQNERQLEESERGSAWWRFAIEEGDSKVNFLFHQPTDFAITLLDGKPPPGG